MGSLEEAAQDVWNAEQAEALVLEGAVAYGGRFPKDEDKACVSLARHSVWTAVGDQKCLSREGDTAPTVQ